MKNSQLNIKFRYLHTKYFGQNCLTLGCQHATTFLPQITKNIVCVIFKLNYDSG